MGIIWFSDHRMHLRAVKAITLLFNKALMLLGYDQVKVETHNATSVELQCNISFAVFNNIS